jgi:hypothetical protein
MFAPLVLSSPLSDASPMRSNSDQTPDQTGDLTLSIANAAEHLGMTSEAVRMRLKRGTLTGAKVDGHWVVYLPAPEQPTERDQTSNQTIDSTPTEHMTEHDQTALVSVYETLVASQREEIAFLRGQLDKRSRELADERERSDVLHREAFARIEALTSGLGTMVPNDQAPEPDDDPDDAPAEDHLEKVRAYADETRKAPESPQAAQDGSGATEGLGLTDESSSGVPNVPHGGFARWWARIFGR